MKRVTLAALLCLFVLGGTGWAQVVTGSIVGSVKDESGLVLPGVTVTLT